MVHKVCEICFSIYTGHTQTDVRETEEESDNHQVTLARRRLVGISSKELEAARRSSNCKNKISKLAGQADISVAHPEPRRRKESLGVGGCQLIQVQFSVHYPSITVVYRSCLIRAGAYGRGRDDIHNLRTL